MLDFRAQTHAYSGCRKTRVERHITRIIKLLLVLAGRGAHQRATDKESAIFTISGRALHDGVQRKTIGHAQETPVYERQHTFESCIQVT